MLLERTQRRLCRLLFLGGCVLPTLAVVSLTAQRLGPGYAERLLTEVGERLGVAIECDRLSTPRPGAYELRGVRLSDPATGAPLASANAMRAAQDGETWRLAVDSLRVNDPQAAGQALRDLLGAPDAATGTIRAVVLQDIELRDVGFALTEAEELVGKQLALTHTGGERLATLARDAESPVDRVTIDTTRTPCPVAWLPCAGLIPDAPVGLRFSGTLQASLAEHALASEGHAEGRLQLAGIETNQLHAASFSAQIEELTWRGDQVVRCVGRVEARDGAISRQLAYGANAWLEADAFKPMIDLYEQSDASQPLPFTQLACEVELDDNGLVLRAGCGEIDGQQRGGAIAHAILEHGGEALMREPRTRPMPPWRLVRAWFAGDAELPSNPAALEVARRLPQTPTTVR